MRLLIKTFSLLFFLAIMPLQAETIILKDGSTIEGTVISQNSSLLILQNFNKKIQIINNDDLYKIEYVDNLQEISKKFAFNTIQTGISAITRPRWAIGVGVPYAGIGNQIEIVINKRLGLFTSLGCIPNYIDPATETNWNANTYSSNSFGLRYYYDTESPSWTPGTGTYLSVIFFNYTKDNKYKHITSLSLDSYQIYETSQCMIGIGFSGKYGIFQTNTELGYIFTLSEKLTYLIGNFQPLSKLDTGLTFSLGFGIAL